MRKHIIFAAMFIVLGQSLFAVETTTSKLNISENSPKTMISLDTFPMLMGGAGVGMDRVLTPKVSLGIYATSERLKANNSGDNVMKLQATGIRSRYFMKGDAASSGWYLGGALVSVNLSTTARVLPTDAEGTASDRQTGFLGSAGYQLRASDVGQGRMMFNLAVLAGTGMGAKFEARSSSGLSSVSTSVANGLGAEASLGFLF